MYFGIVLELSDIDLWNIDLLDTHLDLLDTDIPSKYFACLHNVFKTSSRHVFKTSSRRLQRNNFSSSKTSSRRLARCLQDVLEDVKLLRWRRFEDVFKTNKCLLGYFWIALYFLLQSSSFNFNLQFMCGFSVAFCLALNNPVDPLTSDGRLLNVHIGPVDVQKGRSMDV